MAEKRYQRIEDDGSKVVVVDTETGAEYEIGVCPISDVACPDYQDCHERGYCWLK